MTDRIVAFLTGRLAVLRTWGSIGRVTVWVVVWTVLLGVVLSPVGPRPEDREWAADIPASNAHYLGPTSRQDFAGFIAAERAAPTDGVFNLAWIGGSEVKVAATSVAGEVSNRVHTFGEYPVEVDVYTLIAPRPIDALRAMESAIADGADAIAVSINMVWLNDETSMREWPNLDVANIGTLFSEPDRWLWGMALTSPADVGWRLSRSMSPIVEAQTRLNSEVQEFIDSISLVEHEEAEDAPPEPGDPRLPPDATSFWLVNTYGPSILDDTTHRVATMVSGTDGESPGADLFNQALVDTAEGASVPVLLYVAPVSPESLTQPDLVAALDTVDTYWSAIADTVTSEAVEIETRPMTDEFADTADFYDVVHMNDAGPFADVIAPRLCALWHRVDPTRVCA